MPIRFIKVETCRRPMLIPSWLRRSRSIWLPAKGTPRHFVHPAHDGQIGRGHSPDLMPVEALWRWLREDVTYHHGRASAEDLPQRVAAFEARLNQNPCAVADRLWVKDQLDPEEEKLRFSTY